MNVVLQFPTKIAVSLACEVWQKEWDETGLVSNTFHEILPKLLDKLLENTVLNRLHIGHPYLVSRFGLAVRRYAGKRKDLGSIPLRLSFLFKKVVVCGHCLVNCPSLPTETLKWLSSLPIFMQESFWW